MDCKYCYNTGVILVPDGPDDCAWEACECGKEPVENAKIEYLARNPL